MRDCVEIRCPNKVTLEKLRRGKLGDTEKNNLQNKHYAMARDTVVTHRDDKWLEENKWLMKSNNCKKVITISSDLHREVVSCRLPYPVQE